MLCYAVNRINKWPKTHYYWKNDSDSDWYTEWVRSRYISFINFVIKYALASDSLSRIRTWNKKFYSLSEYFEKSIPKQPMLERVRILSYSLLLCLCIWFYPFYIYFYFTFCYFCILFFDFLPSLSIFRYGNCAYLYLCCCSCIFFCFLLLSFYPSLSLSLSVFLSLSLFLCLSLFLSLSLSLCRILARGVLHYILKASLPVCNTQGGGG